MDWTELSVTVSTEAVEAVANFIHEAGAGGVVIEHQDKQRSTITAYFPVGNETDSVLSRLEEFLVTLAELDVGANAELTTRIVLERDWEEEWKQYYHPVSVGNVYITPSWLPPQPQAGQVIVELDPGMAFGTGTHPTTQMCIEAISQHLKDGDTVLDLGTGSGILAITAAKLGAASVDAVDYDGVAVRVAKENALHNDCGINFCQGDAFAALANSNHQLVVANIGFNACAKLAGIFRDKKVGGTIILSGFPQERVAEFLATTGVLPIKSMTMGDWACLILRN